MPSVFLFVFLTSLTTHVAFGNSCGGLLEGESGHFSLPLAPDREEAETSNSSCLWIIQLHYKANIRFTLNDLDPNSYLNLYPEDQLTACTASNTTKLNATHVGSSLEFSGKTLIVILPKASKFVAFSWAVNNEDNNGSETMKNSDYVSSAQGLLEWQQLESEERVTWAINPGPPVSIKWNLDILTSCNASDNCACVYFAIFQLTSEGILSEAMRTCGQSSEGTLEGISGTVVTLIKVKTSVKANKIAVSWGVEAVVPPVPTGGLFAATAKGLVSLNLRNLQATPLTNEHTGAVAVNHNLKKVYWSEIYENSRIMRSNFDGSAKEVIVPPTGARIYMLAIDKNTGNIYFGVQLSYEITVCSSLGENCTVIISSSLLGDWPYGLALDVDYGGMYWGKQPALVRANLDGSNATIISTEFQELRGLTLKQPLNDAIYWVDFLANTIGTIDVNGGNKRILLELAGNPGPSGIQVDAQKIYFGNFYSRNIQSVNKDTGEELTTIFNSTGGVYNLALFNENPQKKALTFSGANIRFKLECIEEHSHLNLHPEDQLTACTTACNYTKLNSTHIGSWVVIPSKTLIVILPNASSFTSFSWEFVSNDNSGVEIMKNSDYVNSPRGLLKWKQLELEERMTWAINPSEPVNIQWNLDITASCNASDNCACVYFAIFQLTSEGILSEAVRTCGQSSEGKLETTKAGFVVLIKVNTKVEANKIIVSWGVDAPVPPVPTAGLFAATSQGLISLNLQTFEARTLTSEYTLAVAVNHNLEKVYWSQSDGNYNIMRSNFDGSAKEVIIPGQVQDDRCFMLAIEESSGNIYFGLYQSHQITVCNALGKNCTVIISNSDLVTFPSGILLDSKNGVMYWGKRGSPCALVRANLDGSNAKIISTDFTNLRGITLNETASDTIYWADYTDNTIGTFSINGGNKRAIIELDKNPGPFGIQVDAHKIYFGNYHSGAIQSANKDTGAELTTIFNSTGNIRYLALFNEPVQQSVPFPSSHHLDQ